MAVGAGSLEVVAMGFESLLRAWWKSEWEQAFMCLSTVFDLFDFRARKANGINASMILIKESGNQCGARIRSLRSAENMRTN
jgi:hypothetical protein